MRVCSAGTLKYGADVAALLGRRLEGSGVTIERGLGNCALAHIEGEEGMRAWCEAVAKALLRDAAYFELAELLNGMPLSLEEKRSALPLAVRLSREAGGTERLSRELEGYFASADALNLEGYAAFRMREHMLFLEGCAMRAAEETLLESEYLELMQVLAAFVQIRAPQLREVYVILNPDGSCTFTDDGDVRIDYEQCTGDGIMGVLLGLAPASITVYDLSGGRSSSIAETLIGVFEDRVRFFK